jgi:BlaI family penicillinase repressor
MSARRSQVHLSRRERQILDILYQRGPAGVAEIQAAMPESPGYSAVRALLRILEEKLGIGQIRARSDCRRPRFPQIAAPPRATSTLPAALLVSFHS